VVKHHPGTVSTIPGSSKIACTWDDAMPYDLSAVPGTGSMQFEMMTNIHVFKDDLATAKQPKSPKRFFAQLLPSVPVMTNQPTKPCDVSAAAADRKYCDYSSPDAHTLNVKVRRCSTRWYAACLPSLIARLAFILACANAGVLSAGLEREDAVHSGERLSR
jgi:hypothetical protein